jgi:putative oxidoreductase
MSVRAGREPIGIPIIAPAYRQAGLDKLDPESSGQVVTMNHYSKGQGYCNCFFQRRAMKSLFSSRIAIGATNFALLFLRLAVSVLMIPHGYDKLMNYATMKTQFMPFMGLSAAAALALVIFAELFCSIFLVLGFATRLSAFILSINMAVAVFMAHAGDVFGKGQSAMLFLIPYIFLLITGPGAYSIDALITKKRR